MEITKEKNKENDIKRMDDSYFNIEFLSDQKSILNQIREDNLYEFYYLMFLFKNEVKKMKSVIFDYEDFFEHDISKLKTGNVYFTVLISYMYKENYQILKNIVY